MRFDVAIKKLLKIIAQLEKLIIKIVSIIGWIKILIDLFK